MGIQIGSQEVKSIFLSYTPPPNLATTVSGSAFGLLSSSYSNSSTWPSTTGSSVSVINSPLVGSGSLGGWQFNGTDEYIIIPSASISASFGPLWNSIFPAAPFTFLFYGTIGSLSTRRAFFSDGGSNESVAFFRTDTSPGAGKIHLDLYSGLASGNQTNRFTITGTSGSLLNLAVVQKTNGSQSVYQDGVLLAESGGLTFLSTPVYTPWISGDGGTGPQLFKHYTINYGDPYNGQFNAAYLYNGALTATEISQSALSFSSGSNPTKVQEVTSGFLGDVNLFASIPISYSADYLIVAGGGGGSRNGGGGAGAGGLRSGSVVFSTSSVQTLSVIVGAGGTGENQTAGGNGNSSSFYSTSSIGGGGGGGGILDGEAGKDGGSGGGAHRGAATGSGIIGQGFNGKIGDGSPNSNGGGGGGASGTGSNGTGTLGGRGGSGSQWLDGNFYAGGGGGGAGAAGGLGGPGGGGNGGITFFMGNPPTTGSAGGINTGGGAGGNGDGADITGSAGGSGIVIIRYPQFQGGRTIATGGVITSSSGYIYHTFTSSGNFTTYK